MSVIFENFGIFQPRPKTESVLTENLIGPQNTIIKNKLDYSIIALILSNLTVLFGVLFWQWNLGAVIFTYALETILIAFWSILKIIRKSLLGALFFVPLFIFHFGLYILVFFAMSFGLFLIGATGLENKTISSAEFYLLIKPVIISAICLFISHAISFYFNFIKKQEYLKISILKLMLIPYLRISFLLPIVFFGSLPIVKENRSILLIPAFILMKIIFDLLLHNLEHSNFNLFSIFNWSMQRQFKEVFNSKDSEKQPMIKAAKESIEKNMNDAGLTEEQKEEARNMFGFKLPENKS